jgi:CMP-N-acetylneuraminic acid synthetase
MDKDLDITAIIPVRLGSTRCKEKNIRPFFDTNLLLRKINVLKQVPQIKHIIVSTSDNQIITLLENEKELNIEIHRRDITFSSNQTSGSELYNCLAHAVQTQYMMYVTCVSPFVSKEIYSNAINLYINYLQTNIYDSVISCGNIKEFLWKDNQPLNYNINNAPPSQLLPDIYNLSFAFNIISTNYVRSTSSIVGSKPYFYQLDQLSSIDIDTEYDFLVSELLYKNGFQSIKDISNHLDHLDHNISNQPFLLDCTIRDGGFLNNWNYSLSDVQNYYKIVSQSGFDFFECGFICTEPHINFGRWWSITSDDIFELKNFYNGCKLSAMIHINDISKLTNKINGLDMIRVLVNLKKNTISSDILVQIKRLYNLGYQIVLNIAYADILSEGELDTIISLACNEISCVYIADTFGSMSRYSLFRILRKLKSNFNNVGFHGHNNLNLALSNSLDAIDNGCTYIDSCINGIGRGGGNTPTELILVHLQQKFPNKFDLSHLLKFLDTSLSNIEKLKILYTVSGIKKIHPDTVLDVFHKYNQNLFNSYSELNLI